MGSLKLTEISKPIRKGKVMTHYTSIDDVRAYISTITVLNYRNIKVMDWNSPLDNHNPKRNYGAGYAVKYTHDNVDEGYVLFHDGQFGDNRNLAFLIDNGHNSVRPFYLASWSESGGFFILHPITPGQEIGPKKMYSVKVMDTNSVTDVKTETAKLNDFPYVVHTTYKPYDNE